MSTDGCPTPEVSLPDATAPLPDDPAVLQQMIRELLAVLRQTRDENEQLQHRLDLLLRRLYGPRTERFDPNQPLLIPDAFDAPEVPTASDATAAPVSVEPGPATAAEPRKKQRGHGRKGLPANLPRVPVLHELPEAERRCPECGETRPQISTERSEQLDYKPASLFVVVHERCTYACHRKWERRDLRFDRRAVPVAHRQLSCTEAARSDVHLLQKCRYPGRSALRAICRWGDTRWVCARTAARGRARNDYR